MHRLSLLAFLFPALIVGCGPTATPLPPAKPAQVLVAVPVTRQIHDYEDFTGRTEAIAAVEVRARATGYLEKILFVDGAMVKKDQPLFEIDARPYEAEFKKSEAELVQSSANLNRLEADYRRSNNLLSQRAISREVYDKIAADRDTGEGAVGVARANLALAKLNLDYTTVLAPISGRVSRRSVDTGNLVEANTTVLTSIVALDPMYINFDVDERTVLRLRRMANEGRIETSEKNEIPVRFALADEDGFPHEGKIDFQENRIDVGTGTLRMRGIFSNPEQFFAPGLFVRVRLFVGRPHSALLVPERAIGTDQGQKFVYLVNARNEIENRPVKIGSLNDGMRVIEKGLNAGERIVVNGLQRVRVGAKVEAKFAATEP